MYANNDGTRTLVESIAIPEVIAAATDWLGVCKSGVLIGGNAISYHGVPRATMDIDILFKLESDIPDAVNGFERTRAGAFQHNKTHVEVEVITPKSVNISPALVDKVFATSMVVKGVRIASVSGLVALKLQRLKNHDIGDIVSMIKTGKVDLTGFPLSQKNLSDFKRIAKEYV